ncbi:MAG: ATP-dependent DNA helicase [Candidatus Methanoperedens sp.]|nr:ATP-dependent DNA helicase [Candidatus Methanoperedens sp.]
MVEYPWAIDEKDNPVNIASVTQENKNKLKPFYCPYCAEEGKGRKEFIAKPGNGGKERHFAHKPEDQNIKHKPESKEHCDAKMELVDLIKKYLNNQAIFYAGINLENTRSIENKRKIQRINILKDVVKVDYEVYLDNENAETKIKPDISLFNNYGVIRAIEIVVSNPLHEKKKEALRKENIETFELKIEEPDWIKSKLHPEKEIKFEVNQDEAYNIKGCKERIGDGKLCRDDDEQERLSCIICHNYNDILFDFENCSGLKCSDKKCNRMLLKTEEKYCKDCEEKKKVYEIITRLNSKAQALFDNKRYTEAIKIWEQVLILDKENKEAKDGINKAEEAERIEKINKFNEEAKKLFDNGRYAEAIKIWEQVLILDSENNEAKDGIIKAKKAERIEKIDKFNEEAKELFDYRRYAEAIKIWEQVLILDPENKEAKEGIKKANEEITKAIEEEHKKQINQLNEEAKELDNNGKWNEAISRWEEVLKIDPDNKCAKEGIEKAKEKIKRAKEEEEKNKIKIKDLNLPPSVIDIYIKLGITDLYPPQASAIKAGLLDGKNIVAAIPTASGKTLLAEFAMLKSILDENKRGKALYIVPLRALASEKYDRFRSFESLKKSNGISISTGIATGDFDASGDWLGNFDIIVATSEKVDSLLRNKTRWLEEITVIIADEIHLIDSPDRGPTLEIVLAKLRQINPDMQIIALSATIGNANEIAKWLDAEPVVSGWRPIVLKEGVFFGNAITFANRSQRTIEEFHKDSAISLVADTIKEGGQCLIFESSRKSSEGMAARVGTSISKLISGEVKEKLKKLAAEINETSEVESTRKLAMCVENGSAFHHAGLISEQRKIVENGFRAGIIKVISSTPTLAAGLNLPARRVIIKGYRRYDVNFGQTPIPVLEYKQMAGRAGRPRLDPYGEAVLVAKTYDESEELMQQYVLAGAEKIWSKLGSENALRTHILSTIVTGFARNMDELLEFMGSTFYSTQQEPWSLKVVIDKIIEFLVDKKMIVEKDGLFATRLGELVSRLYIDPLSASMILEGMEKIEEKSIQYTDLTLLHLACRTPDMRQLYLRSNDYEWLSDLVMEHHAEFVQIPAQFKVDYEWFLSEVKTACVMLDWINEKKEEDIVRKFGIGEGDIRALSETALWLVHSMAELGKHEKRSCTIAAAELEKRVEYGASPELLDLIQIRGIGRVRARKLFNAGIRDMQTLRVSDLQTISKIIGLKVAVKILKQIGSSVNMEERTEEQRSLGDFS